MKTYVIEKAKTSYVIAIASAATSPEQTAAQELQTYLQKVYGVQLPIVEENAVLSGKAFYVGHTAFAKNNGIQANTIEHWIIKNVNGNIVLTGGETAKDRGILYSVYHFLEDIVGVRWWSYWEEYTPVKTDLVIDGELFREGTPVFPYRKILNCRKIKDFYYDARTRGNVVGDDGLEGGAYHESIAKLGGARQISGLPHHVHTLDKYFHPSEYFEKHPDWFAWSEVEGKRVSYGYCLTNEEYIAALLEKVMANIKYEVEKAEAAGIEIPCFWSISLPDSCEGLCQCEKCKAVLAKGGESAYALQFVNKIAREVAKVYPQVKIETLVYSDYLEPPKDDTLPEKNLVIRLAEVYVDIIHGIHHPANKTYLRLLKAWSDICKQVGCTYYIWEYMYPLFFELPLPVADRLSDTFRAFHEYGITGIFVENEVLSSDWVDLTQYVLLHLSEDPYADAEALIEDFITHYFGAAAPYVGPYYHELRRASNEHQVPAYCVIDSVHFSYLDVEAVLAGTEYLKKALKAVEGDPARTVRVKWLQKQLDATMVIRYFDFKAEAERKGLTFIYDRKQAVERIVAALQEAKGYPRFTGYQQRFNNEIEYFTGLDLDEDNFAPLPAELAGVDKKNVYQFYLKNLTTHLHYAKAMGFTVVADSDSPVGKTARLCKDEATSGDRRAMMLVTERDAEKKKPLSFEIKQDGEVVAALKLYKEDLKKDGFHLYKVGSVSGIRKSAETMLFALSDNYEWFGIKGIGETFPMDAADVYLSMKFTGAHYGGNPEDTDAMFIDRLIVVRK